MRITRRGFNNTTSGWRHSPIGIIRHTASFRRRRRRRGIRGIPSTRCRHKDWTTIPNSRQCRGHERRRETSPSHRRRHRPSRNSTSWRRMIRRLGRVVGRRRPRRISACITRTLFDRKCLRNRRIGRHRTTRDTHRHRRTRRARISKSGSRESKP